MADVLDAVVVGSGASGMLVASRLLDAGLSVLVLECGPLVRDKLPSCDRDKYEKLIAPVLPTTSPDWAWHGEGTPYDWQRVRAAGGRTLVWGGWCLRMDAHNHWDARAFGVPFPFAVGELDKHYHRVETLLGLREVPIEPPFDAVPRDLGVPVLPKRAAVGPCGCRAYVSLDRTRHVPLQPDAAVSRVLLDRRGRACGVAYVDVTTRTTHELPARAVVLCASPVETVRLLLASAPGGLGRNPQLIGKGLTDHVLIGHVVLLPRPAPRPGTLAPTERACTVARFVNAGRGTRRSYRGGFTIEVRGPVATDTLPDDTLASLGVDRADAAGMSHLVIHAMGESGPNPQRWATVDPARADALGRPLPVIHFAWGDDEAAMVQDMEQAVVSVADVLAVPGSRAVPLQVPLAGGGAGHEAGGCRMGRSAKTSVTDVTGAVRGVTGLYVADASLLPTALDRPPTLTVMALALNVADCVVEAMSRRDL
ncbi:MAG: GMC family oxidoreductase [Deltaproteobacteria bacterium]|nr:GMC family oxidoreductase [Deltaproteobacteria bacterium]